MNIASLILGAVSVTIAIISIVISAITKLNVKKCRLKMKLFNDLILASQHKGLLEQVRKLFDDTVYSLENVSMIPIAETRAALARKWVNDLQGEDVVATTAIDKGKFDFWIEKIDNYITQLDTYARTENFGVFKCNTSGLVYEIDATLVKFIDGIKKYIEEEEEKLIV